MNFDSASFTLIHGLAGKLWLFDWVVVFFARYLPYLLVIAIGLFFFRVKEWRRRFYFFSLSALSLFLARGLIAEGIRFFYHRPRPFQIFDFNPLVSATTIDNSFPSGHAAAFFALAFAAYLFLRRYPEYGRRFSFWLILGAMVNAMGRIFVGVHWPSDVLGGMAIGIASAFVVYFVLPKPERLINE